jgi:hypothetical protein
MKHFLAVCLSLLLFSAAVAQSPNKKEAPQTKKQVVAPESPPESLVVCPGLVQPEPFTALGFAKATLVSLWYARNASERGNEMKQAGNEADDMFSLQTGLMRLTRPQQMTSSAQRER